MINMSYKIIIFLSMIFFHITDDYYLQGKFTDMKQKEWWKKQTDCKLYRHDFIMALIEHAFSWTFVMMLPILIPIVYLKLDLVNQYIMIFACNWFVHTIVDDAKANLHLLNLVQDQLAHLGQIFFTWTFLVLLGM